MRITLDTDKEELEEIRHAIAILEDALKRREDLDSEYEEEDLEEEEGMNESGSFEDEEKKELESPAVQNEIKQEVKSFTPAPSFTPPQSTLNTQSSFTPPQRSEAPQNTLASSRSFNPPPQSFTPPQAAPPRRQTQPDFDMSALTMVDKGGAAKNSSSSYSSSSGSSYSTPQPNWEKPKTDNKLVVKGIIDHLRSRNNGQPIQMSNIINLAREKSISEQDAKNLVSELQKEGAI